MGCSRPVQGKLLPAPWKCLFSGICDRSLKSHRRRSWRQKCESTVLSIWVETVNSPPEKVGRICPSFHLESGEDGTHYVTILRTLAEGIASSCLVNTIRGSSWKARSHSVERGAKNINLRAFKRCKALAWASLRGSKTRLQ